MTQDSRQLTGRIAKRLMDVAVSAAALLVIWPALLLIALCVRLSSPGPALFRQKRVGIGGRDFVLLKFRTMTQLPAAAGGMFQPGDSSRVTRIGQLLRKTKLDELPQLLNVLVGQMSLVGPRPEVRKWVEVYPERWARVLTVKPGITDPASVLFRNEEEILAASPDPQACYRTEVLPRKLDLYEAYVCEHSFMDDLGVLWRTVLVVVGIGEVNVLRPAAGSRERS